MKKLVYTSFLLFLTISSLTENLYSQSHWYWQHPYPQGNYLVSLCTNTQNGFVAVGGGGTIVTTTNGGSNWFVINDIFKMKNELSSVYFINNMTGWACGGFENGYIHGENKILKSTNGGYNWTVQLSNTDSKFSSIYFVNENTGWCIGDHLFKTTNGGINWVQLSKPGYPSNKIYFTNAQTGWFISWNFSYNYTIRQIYKTTDGGINWLNRYNISSSGSFVSLEDLSFINAETGWVIGEGTFLKTTNGGNNWISKSGSGHSICFVNETTGYFAYNIVKKTTNSGENWYFLDSIDGNHIRFRDINTGYIIAGNGRIYKTINAGTNWIDMSYKISDYMYDIFFCNTSTGYCACDHGKILKTTNSGKQWIVQNIIITSALTSLYFINELTGWAGSSSSTNTIFKTTNGGLNWLTQLTYNTSFSISAIKFGNENTGYACCDLVNKIFKTTNSGTNWFSQDVNLLVNDICVINTLNVIAVGSGTANVGIIKTTNGGNNWYDCTPPGIVGFNSVAFLNSSTGFTCNISNIYKTTNSGNNWTIQEQRLGSSSILSIEFLNNINGFAVNMGGMIYYTSNGGNSWDSSFTYSGLLHSIFPLNDSLTWIAGFGGTILCSKDFGHEFLEIQNYNNEQPKVFSLSQNYPNPFNPSTAIKFDIPKSSHVQIVVYDILGREVEELLNEERKPGIYEISWDGSRFASGVYFYKIITDDFSQTNKMVLIK